MKNTTRKQTWIVAGLVPAVLVATLLLIPSSTSPPEPTAILEPPVPGPGITYDAVPAVMEFYGVPITEYGWTLIRGLASAATYEAVENKAALLFDVNSPTAAVAIRLSVPPADRVNVSMSIHSISIEQFSTTLKVFSLSLLDADGLELVKITVEYENMIAWIVYRIKTYTLSTVETFLQSYTLDLSNKSNAFAGVTFEVSREVLGTAEISGNCITSIYLGGTVDQSIAPVDWAMPEQVRYVQVSCAGFDGPVTIDDLLIKYF